MNYNTLKTDIANVVKTNGNEEITGALLQQCLLAMISNLGQYYQYGGILLPSETVTVGDVRMAFLAGPGTYSNIGDFTIESGKIGVFTYDTEWHLRTIDLLGGDIKFCGIATPNTDPVYDDRDLCYFASEAGTYTDFDGIQVGIGEIAYLFYNNAESEWSKETLFDLQDYILQTPGTSQTKTMSQKAITDAISAIAQFMNAGWYFGGVVTPNSDEPAAPSEGEPQKLFYIAVGPGVFPLEEALVLENGEIGIVLYDWEALALVDYQLIEKYATQGMLTSAVNQLTEKIAEESAKKVSLNSVEQSLVAGSAMSLSGKSAIVEFLNRIIANKARIGRGAAVINSIRGKTLAWNQQIVNGNFADGATGWNARYGTLNISNGKATLTSSSNSDGTIETSLSYVTGHKYFIAFNAFSSVESQMLCGRDILDSGSTNYQVFGLFQIATTESHFSDIVTVSGASGSLGFRSYASAGESFTISDINFIDLTLMFGAGYEPSTVAEFEALYPGYHAYNPGALISNDAESLETVGFNQWDEEWENGYYSNSDGSYHPYGDAICSKNKIKVFPNTHYRISEAVSNVIFYDADENFISSASNIDEFTTPTGCVFVQFSMPDSYGTTYLHDICINVSDPARNGQYEPYKKSVCPLNIKTRKGKLNGQGQSVIVFPDGMNGVGTSFDEANRTKGTKRRARVNLGDLNWGYIQPDGMMFTNDLDNTAKKVTLCPGVCSMFSAATDAGSSNMPDNSFAFQMNYLASGVLSLKVKTSSYSDPAAFRDAMSGVILDYELAEPQEYVWDEPMANAYAVEYLGTETVIPGNTTDPASAPFVAEIAYPIDLQRGYVSIGTLDNVLSSLVSSGVIPGYSLQFNDNTGDYDCTIS